VYAVPLDKEVVAAIYAEHGGVLRRFALRATRDPGLADDLVQEVVFRAWRKAPEPTNMRGYLLATARNLLIDQYRAAARRPLESVDVDLPERPQGDRTTGSVAEVDRLLDQVLVEEALTRLQPDHREVVRVLYYDGLTVNQAADRLHIPAGTVKSRAYYAVRSLRAVLDEMGVAQ